MTSIEHAPGGPGQSAGRPRSLLLAASAVAVLMGACAHGLPENGWRLSDSELGDALAARLADPQPVSADVSVQLEQVRLRVLPDRQRVRADFVAQVADRSGVQVAGARWAMEAALRWEASDCSLRLTRGVFDRLPLDRPLAPDAQRAQVRLGSALVNRLDDLPLITLPDSGPSGACLASRIRFEPRALEVVFVRAP